MRVHTVVVASALGMLVSSAVAWTMGTSGLPQPALASAAEPTIASVAGPAAPGPAAPPSPRAANTTFDVDGPLRMSGRIGHDTIAAQQQDETFVLVNLAAQTEAFTQAVTPAHVTVVIDRSGSMRGSRMDTALAAARGMVTSLRDGDTVSVVAYDDTAGIIVAPTRLDTRTRLDVLNAIANVRAQGHTCLSCGVDRALALAPRRDEVSHRILLLSDGKANRGQQSSQAFSLLAQQARQMQSTITSIGLGIDYDERLLASLSRQTNGSHHFVEQLHQMGPIFEQEQQALAQSVASSATVEVKLAPGVQLLEVVDRASTQDGNRLIVPFGSFSIGEDKTLLLRVRLPARDAGVRTVGEVTLRYTDAATGRRERSDGTLEVTVGAEKTELDPTVEARIAQSETVRDLQAVNDLIAAGRDEDARATLQRSRQRVETRRDAALARGLAPSAPASANFEEQAQALGAAAASAEDTSQAELRGDADAGQIRKAATKRNAAALNPFD